MMSMAGASSIGALPDPLSMIVRTMSIEAGAITFGTEMRLGLQKDPNPDLHPSLRILLDTWFQGAS